MEKTLLFLSVIVPAYNVDNYIHQCVDSILAQGFKDFELILVDDGSKDRTGEICDEYASADSRVQVVHKKNGGLVSARKAGLAVAKGKYVAYVDGDDWIAPEMFLELCKSAEEENADIVISDFISVLGEKNSTLTQNIRAGSYSKEQLINEIYPVMLCGDEYFEFGVQPSLCSKIISRQILLRFQEAVDDRIRLGEDAACFYPCLLAAEKVVYLKESYFYFYRMRETSISHSIRRAYYTDEICLLIEHLDRQFSSSTSEKSILERELYLYACYMIDNMVTPSLKFGELFCGKQLMKQFDVISENVIIKDLAVKFQNIRTSSRMKRVLKVIFNKNAGAILNLYIFAVYERIYKRLET